MLGGSKRAAFFAKIKNVGFFRHLQYNVSYPENKQMIKDAWNNENWLKSKAYKPENQKAKSPHNDRWHAGFRVSQQII